MTFDYDDLPDIAGMKTLTGKENLHIPTFGWTPIYQDDTGDLVLCRKDKFAFITSDKLEEYVARNWLTFYHITIHHRPFTYHRDIFIHFLRFIHFFRYVHSFS